MKKLFKTLVVGVNLHLFDNPNLSDPITYDSLPDEAVTDIGDNIEKGKKSIAIKLFFSSLDHTLTDKEVNDVFDKIKFELSKVYGSELRS